MYLLTYLLTYTELQLCAHRLPWQHSYLVHQSEQSWWFSTAVCTIHHKQAQQQFSAPPTNNIISLEALTMLSISVTSHLLYTAYRWWHS